MRKELFRMERVTYIEKGVIQLEDFHLQIYMGEIMGLIPMDGHGLSAFLKLLQSNLSLEDGFVYYKEKLINSWRDTPKGDNRISIIQNKSCLVEGMTVYDNIFVLRQGYRQHVIRGRLLRKQLEPFLQEIDMDISANYYVEKLSCFERVVVEMLRGVIMGHRLIILNEISSLLSETEIRRLYTIMRKYVVRGFSFLYISPHFEEVVQVCDRAVLLSNGRIRTVIDDAKMSQNILREYLQGYNRLVQGHIKNARESRCKTDAVLEMKNVSSGVLDRFNLKIYGGRCVVIQSLDPEVFWTLTELLTTKSALKSGEIRLDGKKAALMGNRDIAVIQQQPTQSMIFREMSYMDNLCFGLFRRIPYLWGSRRIMKSVRAEYGSILGEDVFFLRMEELTEKQKYQLVYSRIALQKPRIVFCIQPFKGADFSHRMFVCEMLKMLMDKGIAVVILAVNLSDSMALADRLFRINGDGMVVEISQEEFKLFSRDMPWKQDGLS